MNQKKSNYFFFFSFLPAFAYWYFEENYPVNIAILAGVSLSILEIFLEWFFTKHIHTLSKFNFFLILFLSGLSLLGEDGLWFKLRPGISGVVISLFLLLKNYNGKSIIIELSEMMPNKKKMPETLMLKMEKDLAFFFLIYGIFMFFVATMMSTKRWLFFNTLGFYITGMFFMVGEIYLSRKRMRKLYEKGLL